MDEISSADESYDTPLLVKNLKIPLDLYWDI